MIHTKCNQNRIINEILKKWKKKNMKKNVEKKKILTFFFFKWNIKIINTL